MKHWRCLGGVLVSLAVSLFGKGFVLIFAHIFRALTLKIVSNLLLIMATPVCNLTVDEAHAEFSKLVDQITTMDEKLQSGENWVDQRLASNTS